MKSKFLVANVMPESQNYFADLKHGTTVAIITYLYYNKTDIEAEL